MRSETTKPSFTSSPWILGGHRACGDYRSSLSPTGPPLTVRGRRLGLSVLARGVSMHAWGLRLRRTAAHSRLRAPPCCLPVRETPSASCISVFGAHYPACVCPCPTLRVRPRGRPRMARGQDGSLRLSCVTLSFTAPRRFIPTLSSPQGIFLRHPLDQLTNLGTNSRPAQLPPPRKPTPIEPKSRTMPPDDGLRLHDH